MPQGRRDDEGAIPARPPARCGIWALSLRLIYEEAERGRTVPPPRRGYARHGGDNRCGVVSDHSRWRCDSEGME